MKKFVYISMFISAMHIAVGQVDKTREPGAHGEEVVNAVVKMVQDLCIIDNGIFLRRLAFVESNDGADPKTYRANYHGGIWQVDEHKFNHTKILDNVLSGVKTEINMKLSIDWNGVTWKDLRKPLYSGLAAAMYLLKFANYTIDHSIENQALLWQDVYSPNGSVHDFYAQAKNLGGCNVTALLDVAFVIDTSSSLSYIDLAEAKLFIKDIIGMLPINMPYVRVAIMTFGTQVKIALNFTNTSVLKAVDWIYQIDSSPATTLPYAELLNLYKSNGRPEAGKYVVLITGSGMKQSLQTLMISASLSEAGIHVHVVGVGNGADGKELVKAVSGPVCNHLTLLPTFGDLTSSLAFDIVQMMCDVPSIAKSGTHNYECGLDALIKIPHSQNGYTVKVSVDSGEMLVHGSFRSKIPSMFTYDVMGKPSFGNPLTLFLRDHTDFYLSMKGSRLGQPGCQHNYHVQIGDGNQIKYCNNQTADIVFIIDTSDGVSDLDLQNMKTFIINFVDLFDVGKSAMLISIVTYGDSPANQFWLNDHVNKIDVIEAVKSIRRSSGNRNTGKALKLVRENSFLDTHGGRPRALHVVVVFTEGVADDSSSVSTESSLLKQDGTRVIAVGIGNKVQHQTLISMATSEKHVFSAANLHSLNTMIDMVISAGCEAVKIVCVESGISRNCSGHDIIHSHFGNNLAPIVQSPCTPGMTNISFPHPTDITKYFTCNGRGQLLTKQCPQSTRYCTSKGKCDGSCDQTTTLTSSTTRETTTITSKLPTSTTRATTTVTSTLPTSTTRATTTVTSALPTSTTRATTTVTSTLPTSTTRATTTVTSTLPTSTTRETTTVTSTLPTSTTRETTTVTSKLPTSTTRETTTVTSKLPTSTTRATTTVTSKLNPCIPGVALFLPHPTDNTKYLSCDGNGHETVLSCQPNNIFCPGLNSCSPSCRVTPSTTEKSTTVSSRNMCSNNPCINGVSGYFPSCNTSCYFYCTHGNTNSLKCCGENQLWSNLIRKCVNMYLKDENNNFIKNITNPCSGPFYNHFFVYTGDNRKYIHCDSLGIGHIKTCPSSAVWNQRTISCEHITISK